MPPSTDHPVRATFEKVTSTRTGGNRGASSPSPSSDTLTVLFNPESLQYDVENQFKQDDKTNRVQYVTSSSAKLSLDVVWDTTDTGADVRVQTNALLQLMKPGGTQTNDRRSPAEKIPTCVRFSWGAFSFQGYVSSYKEVLDFFSWNGVPLRARTSVVLTAQDQVFEKGAAQSGFEQDPVVSFEIGEDVPSRQGGTQDRPGGGGPPPPLSKATQGAGGGPNNTGRDQGARNGQKSIRNPSGGTMEAGGPPPRKEPRGIVPSGGAGASAGASAGAGFSAGASAGAGFSAGAAASAGGSFGATAGASAGFSAGASAGFSAGASAGAGFSASAGGFAGASAGAGFSASAGASAGSGFSASAGAFAGASAGAGFSASAGAFAGASAGAGFSASAGAFAGASAGAGFSASTSSFSTSTRSSASFSASSSFSSSQTAVQARYEGLRVELPSSGPQVDPVRLQQQWEPSRMSNPSLFAPGGRALVQSGSYRVDVHRGTRVRFEED